MEIFGVLLIFIMPCITGYMLREITKQKEMNQIETYLIGFFFLFLIQGVVFSACVFTGQSFEPARKILICIYIAIAVLYLVMMLIRFVPAYKSRTKRPKMRKEERILFGLMLLTFVMVLVRIFMCENYIRSDAILETVNTTLQTGTMFKFHPLTGQALESGYIASKKIITLPLYYAFLSSLTGLNTEILLYIVVTTQTVTAAFLSSALLLSGIFQKSRKNLFVFEFIYGLLLLSGDYFIGTTSQRLLWNGYAGDVICAAVMLPYLLFILRQWYVLENSENPPTIMKRVFYILKTGFCLTTSLFLTGIATGLIFLVIIIVIMGICFLVKTIKEVKKCS